MMMDRRRPLQRMMRQARLPLPRFLQLLRRRRRRSQQLPLRLHRPRSARRLVRLDRRHLLVVRRLRRQSLAAARLLADHLVHLVRLQLAPNRAARVAAAQI